MDCELRRSRLASAAKLACAFLLTTLAGSGVFAQFQEQEILGFGSEMRWVANATDPGLDFAVWPLPAFDDSAWTPGTFGVGYELGSLGASNLAQTEVPAGTISVYARAEFTINNRNRVRNLFLGVDYDDGVIVWINGSVVYRSPEVPDGQATWNMPVASHESSNGVRPDYGELIDVSAIQPFLFNGTNVLAVAVYNNTDTVADVNDVVVSPQLIMNRATRVVRRPYIQMVSQTRATVRWRTSEPLPTQLVYGENGNNFETFFDPTPKLDHSVTVSGLVADTRYFYAIGDGQQVLLGGVPNYFFTTAPDPGTVRPVRLWVSGDVGTGDFRAKWVRDRYYNLADEEGVPTDLWLLLGDNAYPDGTDEEYQEKFFDIFEEALRNIPVLSSLGNHDGHSADSQTLTGPYYDIFDLPSNGQMGGLSSGTEAYYSFDFANIHFIVLDSYDTDRATDGAMAQWLELDLAATAQDWIIAFWHHPPYSKGGHDSDTSGAMRQMRENFVPILDEYGVDLTLVGHSHNYERTFLIDGHYGDSTTFDPMYVIDGGDGKIAGDGAYLKPALGPVAHSGTVHVVAGSAAQLSSGPLDHPAMFLAANLAGSMVIDIDADKLDARFITDQGEELDVFRVVKGSGYAPPVADFSAEPRAGAAPLAVNLTDTSTGDVESWSWDVDSDGTEDSTDASPSVVFDEPGLYTVTQTVVNAIATDDEVKVEHICVTDGVPGSLFLGGSTFGLVWTPPAQPVTIDLVRGDLSLLRSNRTFVDSSFTCVLNDFDGTIYDDPVDPAPNQVNYYLVRATNCAGELGGFDSGGSGQSTTRDPAFANLVNACACPPACDLDGDGFCEPDSSCTGS